MSAASSTEGGSELCLLLRGVQGGGVSDAVLSHMMRGRPGCLLQSAGRGG